MPFELVEIEDLRKAKAFKLLGNEMLRRFSELGLDAEDMKFFLETMLEYLRKAEGKL